MLQLSPATRMRVLCLTMLPDGGALTPALSALGYIPYTLKSTFQQGHASRHPKEWSQMLDGKISFNKKLFTDYDCIVGPPGAMLYDAILRECPAYTKVILVEEADKATWAAEYEEFITRLRTVTGRASKNAITVAFNNMLDRMVVRGSGEREDPSSVRAYSFKTPSGGNALSDTDRLKRALATAQRHSFASADPLVGASNDQTTPAGNASEKMELWGEAPLSPRALALQRYEESVKMSIPSRRLLVYRYGDGWGPLCTFLEKPEPGIPFPPYDNGLHVLGVLHDRIARAEFLMRFLTGCLIIYVTICVLPYVGVVTNYLSEMYQDYRVAFGSDIGDGTAAAA